MNTTIEVNEVSIERIIKRVRGDDGHRIFYRLCFRGVSEGKNWVLYDLHTLLSCATDDRCPTCGSPFSKETKIKSLLGNHIFLIEGCSSRGKHVHAMGKVVLDAVK